MDPGPPLESPPLFPWRMLYNEIAIATSLQIHPLVAQMRSDRCATLWPCISNISPTSFCSGSGWTMQRRKNSSDH